MNKKMSENEIRTLLAKENYTLNKVYRKGKHRYINITCKNGHTYEKRLDGYKNGERCQECEKIKKYNEYKKLFESENYKVVSKEIITVVDKPFNLICPNGHNTNMTVNNFKQGKRCKYCSGNQKHSYEYVKEKIENERYTLLSKEYIAESEKLLVKCPNGHEYNVTYGRFRQGDRCPYCSRSKGEEKTNEILTKNNIKIETQKYFQDCVYKSYLYFDFYIPSINTCIEYDGRQHYEPVYFGNKTTEEAEEYLKETKLRDSIKDNYCKEHGIKLIRIPYFEFDNIEKILKENSII